MIQNVLNKLADTFLKMQNTRNKIASRFFKQIQRFRQYNKVFCDTKYTRQNSRPMSYDIKYK